MTQPAWDSDDLSMPKDQWPAELDADYECLGELGRGGMAVVYRARDRELAREVAVKVVRQRPGADDEAVARVAREARTVAKLQHQNIVGVFSVRRLGRETIALIMQLIPGRTLKAELANGPLDPVRAERILRDVAGALAYAHKAGVVHRDVKPENIFIDEVSGRAMLADFGVARVIDAPTELTATGTTIGTPTYMAPEQIDAVNIDTRSDLYSLGIVGWEMLTGQRPWAGESLYNVIYRQKHDLLPPIDSYRADVPPKLQYLVEGLMQKKPDRRWSSAGLFISLLESDKAPPGLQHWQQLQERRRQQAAFLQSLPQMKSANQAPQDTVKFVRSGAASEPAEVPAPTVTRPVPRIFRDEAPPPSVARAEPTPPAAAPAVASREPVTAAPRGTDAPPGAATMRSVPARRGSSLLTVTLAVAAVVLGAAVFLVTGMGRGKGASVDAVPAGDTASISDPAVAAESLFKRLAREDSMLLRTGEAPLPDSVRRALGLPLRRSPGRATRPPR